MLESRRGFIAAILALAYVGSDFNLHAQTPHGMPKPPQPAEPQDQDKNASETPPALSKRALLLQNEKDFRGGVERLYQLTSDLHDEVQKTTTTNVFSVHMYKEMDAIEKLAKQLKSKAKG